MTRYITINFLYDKYDEMNHFVNIWGNLFWILETPSVNITDFIRDFFIRLILTTSETMHSFKLKFSIRKKRNFWSKFSCATSNYIAWYETTRRCCTVLIKYWKVYMLVVQDVLDTKNLSTDILWIVIKVQGRINIDECRKQLSLIRRARS